MKIDDLVAHCDGQIALEGANAKISLIMPGTFGRGTRALCPGGPTGRIVSERGNGTVLVFFPAKEVKTFLLGVPAATQA